ncbi:MAG: STAS domain-containing protein [Planctomycetota bacterium]|jgi:anti-anti-sigma factor
MVLKVLSDDGHVLRIRAAGRIAERDVPRQLDMFDEVLGSHGYDRNVLLSLADTQFIDSSGLSWLVVCHKRFCQAGGKLILHSLTPQIMQLLRLMRLDLAFHLAPDEAAAMEMFPRKP